MSLSKTASRRVGKVFERADLGDPRLVRRAVGLAEALAQSHDQSLPKVWATDAELLGAYRFLRNPRTDFEELMGAVQDATRAQILEKGRVLVLHDTTDISCPAAEPDEVGYLQTGQAGFYVHHALCVGCDDLSDPLGILWSQLWGRAQRSKGQPRNRSGSAFSKVEDRETDRWLEGLTEAQLWAEGCERVIHVMDREADNFRIFEHMQELNADFIVRMRHDRCVEEGHYLSDHLCDAPVVLKRVVPLSPRRARTMPSYTHQGRSGREAELVIRCATLEIQPPSYMSYSEPIRLNVIQVLEENPPPGETAVAWVLATTLPIRTKAQVALVLDFYRARWLIEEFHKALKTGCMFEKRQLESFGAITTLLALCYPIACELLRIRSRARYCTSASDVLRASLLDCLRAHPKAKPLSPSPTAEEALSAIARLGGHLKHNGPPGWQTLAAGYMEICAFERGWLAALAQRDL